MNGATKALKSSICVIPASSSGGEQRGRSTLTSSPKHRYTLLILFPSASDLPLGNFHTPFGHKHKRDEKWKTGFWMATASVVTNV